MTGKRILIGIAAITCVFCILFAYAGCDNLYADRTLVRKVQGIVAAFSNLTADGSATATTQKLTLTFDKDIDGLTAEDITFTAGITGAKKGALTRTGTGVYELAVGGITSGGLVTVTVAKTGYAIMPVSKEVTIFWYAVAAFDNLTANGSSIATTTKLTLTFDKDIPGLALADIILTANLTGTIKNGLTKGTGTGVYELSVQGVSANGDITVNISKAGWVIDSSLKQVRVYYAAPAAFNGLTADGSSIATTTKLTLTFDKDISGLILNDITLTANGTGTNKTGLTRTGTGVYDLTVDAITAGGQITVGVEKTGYEITPASWQVMIYDASAAVAAANTFKSTYSAILFKTADTVAATDEAAIDTALSAYNILSPAAQTLLSAEKSLLDSLQAKITSLKGVKFITITIEQMADETFTIADQNLYRGDSSAQRIAAFDIGTGYTSIKWSVGNAELTWANGSNTFNFDAADWPEGTYILGIRVERNGKSWSRNVTITVANGANPNQ